MRIRTIALALISAAASACGTATSSDQPIGSQRVELTKAADCNQLLTLLRGDAKAKVQKVADKMLQEGPTQYPYYSGGGGISGAGGFGASAGAAGSGGAGGGAAGGAGAPSGHSETNTQVAGVDEADIVKTDGEHIYLLHGEELYVLDSWPAQSLAIEKSVGIEGTPYEMFVDDGKAVVFSRVYVEDGSNAGGGGAGGLPPSYYYGNFTKITVLDVAGAQPAVLRESYVEGSYESSRRHDDSVRAVISGGFKAPPELYDTSFMWDDYGQYGYYGGYGAAAGGGGSPPQLDLVKWQKAVIAWRDTALAAIDATPLEAWLPREAERKNGQLAWTAPACSKFYAPGPGASDDGVTQVVSLDLAQLDAPLGGATILGNASEVYANHSVMVLSHNVWNGGGMLSEPMPVDQTVLHEFDISSAGKIAYTGSGKIDGHVHDQFSIDEKDGILRVTVTENTFDNEDWWSSTTVNRLVTLHNQGGQLLELGNSGQLAPGETIYSTRFLGDRAYVVTFRQVDPLFVLDLSNPAKPHVLGELKIPGFSDYMHPLDSGHLLTIGRNTKDNGAGGVTDDGLLLQIFDVTNPLSPQLSHKVAFQKDGYSDANSNHKAFTFWADKGLLAFPFVGWGGDYSYSSSLEVFQVDAQTGFSALGSIDHTAMTSSLCQSDPYCQYSSLPEVRRGVFIDDFVYSISLGGVLVHEVANLSQPVATLPLPAPKGYK